jgi:hypothetical protein
LGVRPEGVPGTWVVEGNPERYHGLEADLAPDHAALLAAMLALDYGIGFSER